MIADGENQKMMNGGQVIANTSDDHRIHKAIHGAFLQSVQGNPEVAKVVMDHIRQHEALEQGTLGKSPVDLLG